MSEDTTGFGMSTEPNEFSSSAHGAMLLRQVAIAINTISLERFGYAVALLRNAAENDQRVYVVGNGGSATTATHLACDLAKGPPDVAPGGVRAFSLTDNIALMTAWANDRGYGDTLAEQIKIYVEPQDVVIAISVSGSSPNVVASLRAARNSGAKTIGLLGARGGEALHLADVSLLVASDDYGVVETIHLAIAHALAAAVRGGERTFELHSVPRQGWRPFGDTRPLEKRGAERTGEWTGERSGDWACEWAGEQGGE